MKEKEELPLVTVIITTYKRTAFLKDAVESIQTQTYSGIQLIVVDDNAEDEETRGYVRKLMSKYPKALCIENAVNLGGALSRNEGIKRADGRFLAFLDDDDIAFPERIEQQLACYEDRHRNGKKIGLIYCYAERIWENGEVFGVYDNNKEGAVLYEHMLNTAAGTSLWFVPKEVLSSVGGFEQTPCFQDSLLLLKILGAGFEIFCVRKPLVKYREHRSGRISGTGEKNISGCELYRGWCRNYYDQLTRQQITCVEYRFSFRLVSLYTLNRQRGKAGRELLRLIKMKPISKETVKSIGKFLMPGRYLAFIKKLADGGER